MKAPGRSPAVSETGSAYRKKVVHYQSGALKLTGWLYLPPTPPEGQVRLPAVLWNHGADKEVPDQDALGAFYTEHGYAFFVPLRRGHGGSPGRTVDESLLPAIAANVADLAGDRRFVTLLHAANRDIDSALRWLRSQPEIDPKRVALSGVSYGGIETLQVLGQDRNVCGAIVFSGGARLWPNPLLRQDLLHAARRASAPMFLLVAANDYSTRPVEEAGPVLRAKGGPNRATVYPAFGAMGDIHSGHIGFATSTEGISVWGRDALAFLAHACPAGPPGTSR